MTDVKCARCGKIAQGYATIDNERYCHGDQEKPTCYMQALYEQAGVPKDIVALMSKDMPWHERVLLKFAEWVNKPVAPLARWLVGHFGMRAMVLLGLLMTVWFPYAVLVESTSWWEGIGRMVFGAYFGGVFGHALWLTMLLRRARKQLADLP